MVPLLAIDPSCRNCGFAVLAGGRDPNAVPRRVDSGTWHPSGAKGAEDRYDQLASFVSGLVEKHRVAEVVVEVPSGGQRHSATQLMAYARAIGVVEAAAWLSGCKVHRVPVTTWKGNGRKRVTADTMRLMFRHEAGDDNESDALGLAVWHLKCSQNGYRAAVEAALRR